MDVPPAMVASADTSQEGVRAPVRGVTLQITYMTNGTEVISNKVRGDVIAVRGGTAGWPRDKEPDKRRHEEGAPVGATRLRSAARSGSGAPVGIPGL